MTFISMSGQQILGKKHSELENCEAHIFKFAAQRGLPLFQPYSTSKDSKLNNSKSILRDIKYLLKGRSWILLDLWLFSLYSALCR